MNEKIRKFTFNELENFIKSTKPVIAKHFKDRQDNAMPEDLFYAYLWSIPEKDPITDEMKYIVKEFLGGALDEITKEIIDIFNEHSCDKGEEFRCYEFEEDEIDDYVYLVVLYNALKSEYLKVKKWDIDHFWNCLEENRKHFNEGIIFV